MHHPRIGILGGTFNPVHNGHLRHAVEVGEALGLTRVMLTPCASPPHKSMSELLPFELRVAFLREAVRGLPMLEVSTLEGDLEGPSYTWASLSEWHRRHSAPVAETDGPNGVRAGDMLPEAEARPFFMMGAESFAALATWRRGLEMPKLAHLVMVPRGGEDRALFHTSIRRFWPDTVLPEDAGMDGSADPFQSETVILVGPCTGGGSCTFLPVPRLDISSTFVRQRWREGRSLAGLVPKGVLALMKEHESTLKAVWGQSVRP